MKRILSECCDAEVIMEILPGEGIASEPVKCYSALCSKCRRECNFYMKQMAAPERNKMISRPVGAKEIKVA